MNAQPSRAAQPSNETFIISRTFNLPRDEMWKVWTSREEAGKWFGPKGSTIAYKTLDVKSGGAARYSMTFNGMTMHGQWLYKDVKAPERMVAIVSFTDENGNIITHPGMPGWPKETYSVITFTPKGNQTEITVEWSPHNATPEERALFARSHSDMQQGWGGTFEQLDAYLAKRKG